MWLVNGLDLFLLARRLTRVAEDAISSAGLHPLPAGVRSVLADVYEHPDTSIAEISTRTGFPQSHVSSAVATLRKSGALEANVDPRDRRRTLIRPSPRAREQAAQRIAAAPIDGALGKALGTQDLRDIGEVVGLLEQLAQRFRPERQDALGRLPRQGSQGFDAMYASRPPWDIGRPQPAFQELAAAGALRGRVLDVGCGTGEQALMAAELGLEATGVDAAPSAIRIAEGKAQERRLEVRFLVWDALGLASLGEQFDTVLDSGLFHVFDDQERRRYVEALRAAVPPGGRYFMLCFSDRQPGELGPRRVREAEIRKAFAEGWRIDAIEPARMALTVDPKGAQAWRVALTRT
jgi:SAM-dependent methyltransferase